MRRLIALLVLLPLTAISQPSGGWFFPEDAEEKPWEEQKSQLPPPPKQENVVRLNVQGPSSFEFFVDLASVSVGKDGVVRYTLTARSASGAENVSFEGIRCKERERKLYAFGRSDGIWSPARNPQWGPISSLQANRQHAALSDDYFCPARQIVRNAQEARDVLKRGGNPGAAKPL